MAALKAILHGTLVDGTGADPIPDAAILVRIACGTDYPGSAHGWAVGDATPFELMELVSCGLSPMEAIVAATRTTAEAYRKHYRIGIEPSPEQRSRTP
ncbi:MAG: hypothetical protein JXR77_06295 [Lentisphaeria bacterium]|nr:hypothetical protein [Lentisphaeria bacterium]